MDPRELEYEVILACAGIATGAVMVVCNGRDANACLIAAQIIFVTHPAECVRLRKAAESYLLVHPQEKIDIELMYEYGWISDLPRFKNMLQEKIDHYGNSLYMGLNQ